MNLSMIVAELMAKDVERTVKFYCERLGFRLDAIAPEEGVPTWAQLSYGTFQIMIQRRAELVLEMPFLAERPIASSTILVFRCLPDDVREFVAANVDAVKSCVPLRETEYGTVEAGIFDPDGTVMLLAGSNE